MPADHTAAYESLCNHTRETAKLASIMGLLEWDERTKMPPAAGDYRAEQISYLAGEIHKRQTNPAVGEWLAALVDSSLAADPHSATIPTKTTRTIRSARVNGPSAASARLASAGASGVACTSGAMRR